MLRKKQVKELRSLLIEETPFKSLFFFTFPYCVNPPCFTSYLGASALCESAHVVWHEELVSVM